MSKQNAVHLRFMLLRSSAARFFAEVFVYFVASTAFLIVLAATFALGMDLSQFRYATL